MASNLEVESKQNRHLRLQLLYANETTSIIRQVFVNHIDTTYRASVPEYLRAFEDELKALKGKVLKPAAFKELFPELGKKVKVDAWDISLLTCIIVNCCTHNSVLHSLFRREFKDKQLNDVLSENKEAIRVGLTTVQHELLYPLRSKEVAVLDDLDMPVMNHILLKVKQKNKKLEGDINKVLRNVIIKCVNLKCKAPDLQKYIGEFECKLEDLKKAGIFTDSQMEQMFPSNNQIADIMAWDNSLLVAFVSNVCLSVSKETIGNMTKLRRLRNEVIAHKATALIDETEFDEIWKKTSNIILSITKCEFPEQENEWEAKLKHLKTDQLDARRAISLLTELYLKERTEYQQLHEKLNTIESSIKEKLQKGHEAEMKTLKQTNESLQVMLSVLEEESKIEINVNCGSLVFILKATEKNKEYAEHSEDIIRAEMGEGDGDMTTIHAILTRIKDIRQDGNVTVEIKQGYQGPDYDKCARCRTNQIETQN